MADNTLLNLAKQGKPGAIAAMLNRSFQKEGWTCKGRTNGNELKLTFEGENPPQLEDIRDRLMRGLKMIQPEGIEVLVLESRKNGQSKALWMEVIALQDNCTVEENISSAKSMISPKKTVISQVIQSKNQVLTNSEEKSPIKIILSRLDHFSGVLSLFFLTIIIVLLFLVAENQKQFSNAVQKWEYKIESFEDYEFSNIDKMGAEGWELVAARRALTGDNDERRGVYECIFKRPLKGRTNQR